MARNKKPINVELAAAVLRRLQVYRNVESIPGEATAVRKLMLERLAQWEREQRIKP